MTKRIRVAVLFGGRSGEHEVSLASARSILESLDPDKYEAVPIGITREGQWLIADSPQGLLKSEVTSGLAGTEEAVPDMSHHAILRLNEPGLASQDAAVDVVFPALHGTHGEDGTIQGLLEIARIPYVGSAVLGSSVSMDKIAMKAQLEHAGLPSVAYVVVNRSEWESTPEEVIKRVEEELVYPVFPKPANSGSSVGISKARDREELRQAITVAARYDRRVIVEQGVDAREIEMSVLGNDDPIVSVAGEVVANNDFYDYEAKYSEGLTELLIPADLIDEQAALVHDYARRAFLAVDAAGLARVDFFIRNSDGKVIVNEINTMPGFTATSMFPKLWEASGISYPELVDRLIQLAFERFEDRQRRTVTR